jgi:hypothetical protein
VGEGEGEEEEEGEGEGEAGTVVCECGETLLYMLRGGAVRFL